ncbi:hypothetical protein A3H65_01190 [Candidatus Giovannonibacteria bacterium RIFCSPLOWO2_02_FULL_45_14]|uniref:Dihydrofolate reductase n=1 Tax=Candidatus Giovannonibacteria bacterium RIFCSPLOWO2_12_FULL_44_15 TaxID=1798364 RepID=A0A1F5Y142_9BACT|nr:MAG: hypothetical protein A3E62_00760 [Candidatus Giovannonibacteria bacterium RIFCSPHIGHO2_12_FULL_44_29]OGF91069.1 MAG: hypothetical protein A3H65_01190 [Candidatus Giovannonibacteria bacterium RIFCSPLOWO2_02_FULL_45_14]OGF93766.1 MAG: hypothetical protein A3G54_02555 [Candidatus Giovannonibacteria bacterium RIFCSPLOWO2_12_FULL_44_15]
MDAGIKISLVTAFARDSKIIGSDGNLPWRLSDDLKHLRKLTLGKIIIVGRKTEESIVNRIGHSLPNRKTIVLTRDKSYHRDDCETAASWDEAIKLAEGNAEIFVLGGEEIYKLALPFADTLYLTIVDAKVEGDAAFPNFDESKWDKKLEKKHAKDENNEYDFEQWVYTRKI